jgi:hypothetical protein
MQIFKDVHNRSIRLNEERRFQLETEHPEMTGQIDRIAETLANPDKVIRSKTDATVEVFYRHYQSTPVASKFLCTVVKVLPDDHFIITAYYTDAMKRGEVLWEKK